MLVEYKAVKGVTLSLVDHPLPDRCDPVFNVIKGSDRIPNGTQCSVVYDSDLSGADCVLESVSPDKTLELFEVSFKMDGKSIRLMCGKEFVKETYLKAGIPCGIRYKIPGYKVVAGKFEKAQAAKDTRSQYGVLCEVRLDGSLGRWRNPSGDFLICRDWVNRLRPGLSKGDAASILLSKEPFTGAVRVAGLYRGMVMTGGSNVIITPPMQDLLLEFGTPCYVGVES